MYAYLIRDDKWCWWYPYFIRERHGDTNVINISALCFWGTLVFVQIFMNKILVVANEFWVLKSFWKKKVSKVFPLSFFFRFFFVRHSPGALQPIQVLPMLVVKFFVFLETSLFSCASLLLSLVIVHILFHKKKEPKKLNYFFDIKSSLWYKKISIERRNLYHVLLFDQSCHCWVHDFPSCEIRLSSRWDLGLGRCLRRNTSQRRERGKEEEGEEIGGERRGGRRRKGRCRERREEVVAGGKKGEGGRQ